MGGGVSTQRDEETVDDVRSVRDELIEAGVLEHQLKSDATVVNGWATTLDESWDALTERQKRDAVRIIRRRSAALADLAQRGLSGVARSWPTDSGHAHGHDVAESVREVTEEMAMSARDHVVRYEGPTTLECDVDLEIVARAVQQLIENAAKYSAAGSEIVVKVDQVGPLVEIDVVDEGIGIPPGNDLFDPFVRHNDEGERVDGSGLGLFMVRSTIEASGGNVSARRNATWGSTFHIELPTA